MNARPLALTGPHAASLYQLDGFRDVNWPVLWCAARPRHHEPGVIRTHHFGQPEVREGLLLAPVANVLRHLGTDASVLWRPDERITPIERVELAVEYSLRNNLVAESELLVAGGSHAGDVMIRRVVRARRHEPPTESYAETRGVQLLRDFGWECWRQMVIVGSNGRPVHRVDLVIPFVPIKRRPVILRPSDGLIVEIDSREFHEGAFERDHSRQSTYDALGYHWITLTPRQIEHEPKAVQRAIDGALSRVGTPVLRRAS